MNTVVKTVPKISSPSAKTSEPPKTAGLTSIESGNIIIDETDATNLPMYRRARLGLGYLPQESSIFKGLSVEKNIMAVLEISIKDKQERKRELELLLGEFSITHLRQASAITLSGGERRRVEIARCLASKPKYILLDEPFAGVDPIAVNEIRKRQNVFIRLVSDLYTGGITYSMFITITYRTDICYTCM